MFLSGSLLGLHISAAFTLFTSGVLDFLYPSVQPVLPTYFDSKFIHAVKTRADVQEAAEAETYEMICWWLPTEYLFRCVLSTKAAWRHRCSIVSQMKKANSLVPTHPILALIVLLYCSALSSSGTLSTSTDLQKVLNSITEPRSWQISCYILLWLCLVLNLFLSWESHREPIWLPTGELESELSSYIGVGPPVSTLLLEKCSIGHTFW